MPSTEFFKKQIGVSYFKEAWKGFFIVVGFVKWQKAN